MKRLILGMFAMILFFFTIVSTSFSQCGRVANDLSMTLPCAVYEGSYFTLTLNNHHNPADPSGLYWRFGSIDLATSDFTCAQVDAELNITAPCVYFSGTNLSMYLEKVVLPADPDGLYWKMGDEFDINPVTITEISGDTTPCFDPSFYTDPEFMTALTESITCLTNCGEDPVCLMECMPDLGIGSAFSLAFTLYNPGTETTTYTLPAGSYFMPEASDVQPMLVISDQTTTLTPGATTTVCIPTYCMDGSASAPSDSDIYSVHDIARKPCLVEIMDLLREAEDISHANSSIIQDAVWNCMETDAITETMRAELGDM